MRRTLTASLLLAAACGAAAFGALRLWRHPTAAGPVSDRAGPNVIQPPAAPPAGVTPASPSHPAKPTGEKEPVLVDVAEVLGFDFTYYSDGRTDRFFLPEIMGGGATWLDFDADGWVDLFVPNGCVLPFTSEDTEHVGRLFRNLRGTRFADVSVESGVVDLGYGQGTCSGDLNNDGFTDLYVTHVGSNRLWINNGDGTYSEAGSAAGATSGTGWSSSCAMSDLDRDGDLDLYVVHYVKTSLENIPLCTYRDQAGREVRGYCGPDKYTGEDDDLYCNQGDGTFRRINAEAACEAQDGKGLAIVIADLNNDAWPDIYVANDMVRNLLFWNRSGQPGGSMRFEESALSAGSAVTGQGRLMASMGIACADYDRNGWLDLYITNYLDQGNRLFHNQDGMFVEQTSGANLLIPSLTSLGFGTGFFDFDNDGWLDLFVTNGHVLGPLVGPPDRMRAQVYRNTGGGRFVEMTDRAGPYFHHEFFGRGLAFCDFTNSGGTGLVLVHQNEPAALLRNDTRGRGHFLGLQFAGARSNRTGLNARVTVRAGGAERVAESTAGGSYLSDSDHRLVIGLGDARAVERLEVRWPSGTVEEWKQLAADRYWLLREGRAPSLMTHVVPSSPRRK